MAVTITCPRCTHEQTIMDETSGKDVVCKICHHVLRPGQASTQVASAEMPLPAVEEDALQAGPPPVTASKRDERDQIATKPRDRRRVDDDDDDDDESAPRQRRRPAHASSGMPWVLVGAGMFLLVALLCGGIGLGGILLVSVADAPAEPIQVVEMPAQAAPPFGIVNGFPQPAIPGGAPALNPGDPQEIERTLAFLKGTPEERGQAFAWLQRAEPNHPRRAEVARELEPMVDQKTREAFSNNSFFPVYFRWVTKDNVPSLIRLAENDAFTPWDNERRHKAMQALGKLKEPRGAPAMARRLGNHFDGGPAMTALTEMGPAGQPVVIKYFNHPDGNARNAARLVIQHYGTPKGEITAQGLLDLDSGDAGRRTAALQWFAVTPADPAQQPAVAKALNKSITDHVSVRNRDLMAAIEKWGTVDNVPPLLKYFNHEEGWTRDPVRKTVQALKPDSRLILAQCLTDLDAFDPRRRDGALDWFARNTPTDPQQRAQVGKALNKSIDGEGSFGKGHLAKCLENWGTAENVAKLIPILDSARLRRGDIVRILGKIRDPNGLEAVARRITHFFDGNEARAALKDAGRSGEDAVVKVMVATADAKTRIACARFLGEIGTRSGCSASLQQITLRHPQDVSLRKTVQASLLAIGMRP